MLLSSFNSFESHPTQITQLKQLVIYGARTEREPRPFYPTNSTTGQRLLEQFRFGHTTRGSFGLSLESPLTRESDLYKIENPYQIPLYEDLANYTIEPIVISPIERRIMERFARGLTITKQATSERELQSLINGYSSGFNGNMCDAIVKLTQKQPVEFRILWSPKLPVSEDAKDFANIRLNQTSYDYLERAAKELKTLKPYVERIRGIVTHVGSEVAPLGDNDHGRSVIIRWIKDGTSRTAKIVVPLNREDYLRAHEAHKSWSTVEVSGVLEKVGSLWRLVDPKDFEVVN